MLNLFSKPSEDDFRLDSESDLDLSQPLIFRFELDASFPAVVFTFKFSFFNFPSSPPDVECSPGKPKRGLNFPAKAEDLWQYEEALIKIEAHDRNVCQGSGEVSIAELFQKMSDTISQAKKFPVSCTFERSPDLKNQKSESLGPLKLKITLTCLGQTICEDIENAYEGPAAARVDSLPVMPPKRDAAMESVDKKSVHQPTEVSYDEIAAEVNGYGLKILMQKEKKGKTKKGKKKTGCYCGQPSENVVASSKYKVRNCSDADHEHLKTRIKVTPDDTGENTNEYGYFTFVIGRGKDSERGQVEIHLQAPKPFMQPEDYKKDNCDAVVQTEKPKPPKKEKKPY